MAGTHNFQVFDSANTNMTSDTDYTSNAARASGVSLGIADPALANKTWHQASIMAAALAQFLVNQGNTISDTNLAGIVAALMNSIAGAVPLVCTKVGTAYALTGTIPASGLIPCMFSVPSAYVVGDTFTVNGVVYALAPANGVALAPNAFAAGVTLSVILDVANKKINIQKLAMTKSEVGLSLVDNTADANKSVNYANSSGYANSAGSAPANGGNANVASYASGAIALTTAALRNATVTQAAAASFLGVGVINIVVV